MHQSGTSSRLIEAAIEVFLTKGYEAATIREICAQADANIAAVNYHFGSKEALYAAALERVMEENDDRYPMSEGFDQAATPEDRLRLFIRNLLRMNFPEDEAFFQRGKLFWREMGNPSPIFRPMVERFMQPIKTLLEGIIEELTGPLDLETLSLCAGSVAGQCMFHSQSLSVIQQLYPHRDYSPESVRRLARHIHEFSLKGLEAVRERQGRPS